MSREKQIEELIRDLVDHTCMSQFQAEIVARMLFQLDYRKQSEVIDEFAERLKEAPIKCGLPLFGLTTKGEVEEYFDNIMLQVRDAIDSIATEMKGGAE